MRARMVKTPQDYRWSSWRAHALGETITWLADHAILHDLGATAADRYAAYRALGETPLRDDELTELRHRRPTLRLVDQSTNIRLAGESVC